MKMYFKKHHGLVKLTITQNTYKYNLLRTVLIILFLQKFKHHHSKNVFNHQFENQVEQRR
jgi:hypothetical protein